MSHKLFKGITAMPLCYELRYALHYTLSLLFFRKWLLFTILALSLNISSHALFAQTRLFSPENLTNRRLGYLSDAAAVGWNPATLGMRGTSEILLAAPLGTTFSPQGQYGAFVKLSPLAVGYTLNADSSLASGEFYAGLGFNIIDDILWLGASGRLVNPGDIQRIDLASLRWNGSLMLKPLQGLFLGVSATTMGIDNFRTVRNPMTNLPEHSRTSPNDLFFTASATYTPLDWLNIFANFSTLPNSAAAGQDLPIAQGALGLDFGASASLLILGNPLVVSANYSLATSALRIGAEVNLGAFGVGVLNTLSPALQPGNSTALLRFSSDPLRSSSQLLGYRADDDGCRTPVDSALTNPNALAGFLRSTKPEFMKELDNISPETAQLFTAIQERYYKPQTPVKSIAGDAIDVQSRQGYALQVLSADNSRFPQTTVVVRAQDKSGKSVQGLGMGDFSVKDPLAKITAVKPADSTVSTPVDVVLIIDCSGSMTNKIRETRENAKRFVDAMRKRGADYRIGGILYGLQVVSTLEPTDRYERFEEFIAKASANQPDEYLPNALGELATMKFRANAERIGIVVTDELTYTNRSYDAEPEIIEKLWKAGIRLNKIVKPCDNNGSATAYLTLGREYNIKDPFEGILNDIGRDITTTYAITYRRDEPKVTAVEGTVKSETGAPLAADITLTEIIGGKVENAASPENTPPASIGPVEAEPVAGRFSTPAPEGKRFTVLVEPRDTVNYAALTTTVDLTKTAKGDTVKMPEIKLRRVIRPIILKGKVSDVKGNAVQADISLTENIDETTQGLAEVLPTSGSEARYQKRFGFGKSLSLFIDPALQDEYIPLATEFDFRSARQGDTVIRDFVLSPMPKEITVFGKVRVKQPTPKVLENATVTASEAATGAKIAETRTDREGNFALTLPKGRSVGISVQAPEYYADTTLLTLPKRDTSTRKEQNIALIWQNVIVQGKVEAEKSGMSVPAALVVSQKNGTDTTFAKVSTEADGTYRMIVPKDTPLRFTAQSSDYFFTSETAQYGKFDTVAVVKNFRLPEALTLRINFPTNEFANPSPFVLDSNGVPGNIRWQDELDRVAANLLLFKNFLGILTITGHTDDVSSDDYNRQLGQRRAEFVVAELIKRGIPQDRLQAASEGEKQLLSRRTGENTDLYRARCRRVELVKNKR